MHPHTFFLLLSSGVSSYFLAQNETPHLLNETKFSLIDEMLCLLEAEKECLKEKFLIPLQIKKLSCAHNNTEVFIHELKKIPILTCMTKVEKDMQKLEKNCSILKESSSHHTSCSTAITNFSQFKERLKEFLRWVNEKPNCSSIGRSELGFYLDGKCSCR